MTARPTRYEATWESLAAYEVPEWFRDAKFGIFIHWGPYSVPAWGNEWYARNMYQMGSPEYEHHREVWGPQNEFGYKDFIPLLTGESFDADAWAALFREAGAQYVVPVAVHHDGFAMYRSELNPWNAAVMGPKRDVIGELSEAVRRRSMTFGVSTHRAELWWFLNGGMAFDSDVRDPRYSSFYGPAQSQQLEPNEQFLQEWVAHTLELVDAYEPQLLYFDWWIHRPGYLPYLPKIAAHYYNRMAEAGLGPVLTYKDGAFPAGTAVEDVERGASATLRPQPWQACTSIGRGAWCHVEGEDYKTPGELVGTLVDTVAKNGSLLLNVGPKADGTIHSAEAEVLREIGAWLAVNGEAIYGTRPWSVYGEGPARAVEGKFMERDQDGFGPRDLRFTTRGDVLYVLGLSAPQDGRIEIRSLGSDLTLYQGEVKLIELLGHTGEFTPVPLEFERGPHALTVRLPESWTAGHRAAVPLPVLRITAA
ncbi:alpha-L-fucosidase [Actinospica durhamensis]|uniref:alpha-L-fucosidase n=1 Tax=Actinospica durhamensis TaxID=1508375 RepID=A0A941INP2_9ACTN|nr:alpha-L-fucosidase [Actinospica durhamensis]MBR7834194.1 alpha-L-fucosidase [Actinospica durhamensis]